MGQLSYNGLPLPYPMTETFNQEAVMEESSTDLILTKFEIEQECIVNADHISNWTTPADREGGGYSTAGLRNPDFSPATTNPADIMNAVRKALLRPRRSLSFKSSGVEMIPTTQGQATGNLVGSVVTGTVDSKNGPVPAYCRITQLSEVTFLMRYKVVAHYWENPSVQATTPHYNNKPTPGAIIAHRWQESIEIDRFNYTTKTRTGKYTIRSDNSKGVTADQLRTALLNSNLPAGFTRESCTYNLSKDGLSLDYTIRDKENFRMPPRPAFEGEGYYNESIEKNGAGLRRIDCYLRLRGQKTDNIQIAVFGGFTVPVVANQDVMQTNLYNTALFVVFQKIRSRATRIFKKGGNDSFSGLSIIDHFNVRYNFYENVVEVRMSGRIPSSVRNGKGLKGNPLLDFLPAGSTFKITLNGDEKVTFTKTLGFDLDAPGSDDTVVPRYAVRGTAGLTMAPAPYFNPNTNNDKPATGGNILPGQAGTTAEP